MILYWRYQAFIKLKEMVLITRNRILKAAKTKAAENMQKQEEEEIKEPLIATKDNSKTRPIANTWELLAAAEDTGKKIVAKDKTTVLWKELRPLERSQ